MTKLILLFGLSWIKPVKQLSSAQYLLWTSGICRCCPDCLELFARGHAESCAGFWGQLQAVTEGVFICSVL